VSILRSFARFGRSLLDGRPFAPRTDRHCAASKQHTSRFEQLEERKPLTANPFPDIHLGAVYLEPASGNDASPNVIQVTFQGGAPGTQLTQIVINGDKDHNGRYSSGEIFFDTAQGGQGVFNSAPFHIVQANGFTVKNVQVSDGGQQLIIDLQNFVAGDKLVFSIDVDEVQFVDSSTGEVDVNAVVEGDEFQRSTLTGNFTAPHYHDAMASPLFWDEFDQNFSSANAASGSTLDLPPDSYEPPSTVDQTDLTAGAVATLAQVPLPSTISGTVYHDKNLDNLLEASEQGISGVTLTLLQWNGNTWVSTGKTTQTDAGGNYEFDALLPGKYRVAETQPAGWLSVGSQPGTVDGAIDGVSTDVDTLSDIVFLGGQDGVHYNFGECLPASISGKVWSDTNGDCLYQPQTDVPLSGVQIDLLDSHGTVVATTTTDQQGDYQFTGLVPGTYGVFEHQPAGYLEGMDSVGTVNGVTDGAHGGTDLLSQIVLGSGAAGIDYDFCEILPASLSGKVWSDVNGDCVYQPQTDVPLAGVKIDLLDSDGNTLATTTTDSQGNYKFDNLTPGTYGVREHQPAGYLEGMDILGTVGGVTVGTHGGTDLLTQITLGPGADGIDYNFCEELPASLSGRVWNDTNGDCVYQPQTDLPLAGVQIDLLDSHGQVVATTTTDSQGQYKFENLTPGTYSVFEHQPAGYLEDMDILGTVGGVTVGTHGGTDLLSNIVLGPGTAGIDYNFCEVLPASLAGKVWNDTNGDCVYEPQQDIPLAGVQIDLLDSHGAVVATTLTDQQGNYKFDGLTPGTYSVREHQPAGYLEGMDILGTVGGVTVGTHGGTDLLSNIVLGSGAAGIDYDFCEELPASLSGKVWNDTNGDCAYEPGQDIPLAGVQIDLLDTHGNVVGTTLTDQQGNYKFDGLTPGTYSVREHQPTGYLEGMDILGTVGGVTVSTHGGTDLLSNIVLGPGAAGIDYDFCEELPASLAGKVWNDTNGDCVYEPETDIPLSGVKIDLLDNSGNVVATTSTDSQGNYQFTGLGPGVYGVREHQPAGYLEGMDILGTVGGVVVGQHGGRDLLAQITLGPGAAGVDYDFCEELPATISGYVFQDGPPIALPPGETLPDITTIRDGARSPGDKPIAGVTLLLYDQSGNAVLDSAGHQRTAVTNAGGYYEFTGLVPGTYLVREIQPAGYIDGIDTPGTTGGVADNPGTPAAALPPLTFDPNFDVIASIPVTTGQTSRENNFSEVVVQHLGITPTPQFPAPPPPLPLAGAVPPLVPHLVFSPFLPPPPILDIAGADVVGFTWHLSIIDAGYPRGPATQYIAMNFASASLAQLDWSDLPMTDAEWILLDADGHAVHRHVICFKDAVPVAGDFNGDGIDELGLYVDGQWFIDLNGNGRWDAGDLWAKLGTRDDKPVVGDWNGDGKADIGIFGPAWPRDPKAIQTDPGLPDPANRFVAKRKQNLPPDEDETTLGRRRLQPGKQGKIREDLIDHVFHYGVALETPVVGDWTGAGIRRIGTFYNGVWTLDTDGDGRLSESDLQCQFGQAGDIPVVGDWTGDGIEKIGVYRNGTWYLDTNNNHRLDSGDRVVELGQPGDLPVVGNFNGNGRAAIGVYRAGTAAPAAAHTAAAPSATIEK